MTSQAKILVIDDEMIVLKSCAKILTEGECEVDTVPTDAEGLQRLKDETFDSAL